MVLERNQKESGSDTICVNFDMAWKTLYKSRWSDHVKHSEPVDLIATKQVETLCGWTADWRQMYWEKHLQNCLDAVSEIALLPSFDGCIGEIKIPDVILEYIGFSGKLSKLVCDYSTLSYHCKRFGLYARCLRLQNVLCISETCHLLRNSKLECLELRWIKCKEQVEGLCQILVQKCETLTSIKFIHCKLSSVFINAVCNSLLLKGHQTHGIKDFSIETSSFLETNSTSLPVGLASFLSTGRLSSLCFSDNHLGQSFASMVFKALLDTSSSIAVLDLSENNISGWLSCFKCRCASWSRLSGGVGKSLQSLCVLNLRGNNLQKYDAECLKYALIYMPNLETLDLSDNPIGDDGIRSFIPYFVEMSEGQPSLTDLRLKNCELTYYGVSQLLQVLSTLRKPLKALSIGDNDLGSKVGAPLGKFLLTGILALDIEDIGLGSAGFFEAQKELMVQVKLAYINISKNHGGIKTAHFLSKLILQAPDLVAVNAGYNFMPVESLSIICSSLKLAAGRLERLDLTGNPLCDGPSVASLLADFKNGGKSIVVYPLLPASRAPYDDDP